MSEDERKIYNTLQVTTNALKRKYAVKSPKVLLALNLLEGQLKSIHESSKLAAIAVGVAILSSVSLKVVAEFTVSTSAPATAGVRAEQTALLATEDSYKHYGPNAAPPKLLVNTVIPKSAGAKYGFNGVEGGLHAAAPAISKQYHIREQGLLVVEDLAGSRFINWIPRQILEVIIRYRAKELLIAESDLARLEAYDRLRLKGSDQKNPNTLSHWPQLSTKNRLFPDRSILNILSPLNEHHVKNMLGMKALQFTTSTIEL